MSRYGRMRASFDSDGSLGNSPPMSPPRGGGGGASHPAYFVQSPSRDSTQDVDSLSQSFSRATPRDSPLASPLHKHFKHASAESVSFHTTPKPGSRRVLPQPAYGAAAGGSGKKGFARPWAAPGTILEEEEGIEGEKQQRLSRCCLIWIALFFTLVAFFIGAFIFWLVTMPKPPHVTVENVVFSYFDLEDGVDNSGVPTKIVSLNATATLSLYNPSRFFGYHICGSPIGLDYLDLSMAGGQLSPDFLEKRTTKKLIVSIAADKEFLHGAGPSFDQLYTAGGGVPLKLEGTVFSRAYVMGKMIKNKFANSLACTFSFTPAGPTQWKVQQLSCLYAS